MIKVTTTVLERHMKQVDYLKGKDLESLNSEQIQEIASEARQDRMNHVKKVFEEDPIYAGFATRMSQAAADAIKTSILTIVMDLLESKGTDRMESLMKIMGGLKRVESLLVLVMLDTLVFSYELMQDSASEDFWHKQLSKDETTQ